MPREPYDHKGRVNHSLPARFYYLSSFEESAGQFDEVNVTYYWDWMDSVPGQEELNFLAADWQDFITKCNPSAFARSWGADCRDWLTEPGFSSAGLFGQLIANPIFTIRNSFETLFEMARVKENDWAREMISGLIRNHRILDHETGDQLVPSFATQFEITESADKVLDHLDYEAEAQ